MRLISFPILIALITITGCMNQKKTYELKEKELQLKLKEIELKERELSLNNFDIIQLSDIEGRTYKTVKIGNQEWMAENLNVTKFRNGDIIPEATTPKEWENAGQEGLPIWCYYKNDVSFGKIYGKLYNWLAVNDPRGLAPLGWHIPSDNELLQLVEYLGGKEVAGTKMKSNSNSGMAWAYGNIKGTNESGFSGIPGGYIGISGGSYDVLKSGFWWSSTGGKYFSTAYAYQLYGKDDRYSSYSNSFIVEGRSVRCLKD